MLISNHLSLSLSLSVSLTFSNFCSFSLSLSPLHTFLLIYLPSPSLGLSFILFHLHLKISTSHSFQIKICFFFLYCICSKSPFLIVSSTLVGITTSQAAKERGEEFCHHRWSEVDWLSLSLFRPSLFLSFFLSLMWRQQKNSPAESFFNPPTTTNELKIEKVYEIRAAAVAGFDGIDGWPDAHW